MLEFLLKYLKELSSNTEPSDVTMEGDSGPNDLL